MIKLTSSYPDFVYIGVARAGSTWIYECLKEHPEIFVPRAKDIEFFNHNFSKGVDWYSSFFKTARQHQVKGELSHDYYLLETTAKRIFSLLPNIKIICCLREPVDKMVSHYLFAKRLFPKRLVKFEDLIDKTDKITKSFYQPFSIDLNLNIESVDYYRKLLPFYRLFNKQNILVQFFDELNENPSLFIKRIYQFLGVSSNFQAKVINQKINRASEARLAWATNLSYKTSRLLKKTGQQNFVGQVKGNKFIDFLLHKPIKNKPVVPATIKKKISDFASGNYEKLSQLIDRPLPSSWYKNIG